MVQANMDRRTFVEALGALGALSIAGVGIGSQPSVAVAAESAFPPPQTGKPVEAKVDPKTGDVSVNEDVIVRYSGCVGCYQSCGNRIKLDRATGRVLGVGGNPYNPSGAVKPLPFEAPLEEAYRSMSYANGAGNLTRGTIAGAGTARSTRSASPGASPRRSSAPASAARASGSPSAGTSFSRR